MGVWEPPEQCASRVPCLRTAIREFWAAVLEASRVADQIANEEAQRKQTSMSEDVAFEVFQQLTPDFEVFVPSPRTKTIIAKAKPFGPDVSDGHSTLSSGFDSDEDDVEVIGTLRQPSPDIIVVPSVKPLTMKWRVRTFLPGGTVLQSIYKDTDMIRFRRCLTPFTIQLRDWQKQAKALETVGCPITPYGELPTISMPVSANEPDAIDALMRQTACNLCFRTMRHHSAQMVDNEEETKRFSVNMCGHWTCHRCMEELLRNSPHCPLCRQPLRHVILNVRL